MISEGKCVMAEIEMTNEQMAKYHWETRSYVGPDGKVFMSICDQCLRTLEFECLVEVRDQGMWMCCLCVEDYCGFPEQCVHDGRCEGTGCYRGCCTTVFCTMPDDVPF